MVKKIFFKGAKIFTSPQNSVMSAATVIMIMILASRILGLVRQRVLAHFFIPDDLALFFAAFRLPDLIFEVLVYGSFSSAFIPVFTKSLKEGRQKAWEIASIISNIGLLAFVIMALAVIFFASHFYGLFAPGFSISDREIIIKLTKILFLAQGFFVISYVLTGVLESLRRFLVPALAPLFYNLGIILGTIIFAGKYGLFAPVIGVVIGAFMHFAIQLPFAIKMGFKFRLAIKFSQEIKKIGRLALPRVIEVSFTQVAKTAELFFASIISTASYTYYTFGNSIQLIPIGLFGTSIAKAALPTLSRQADKPVEFKKTLFNAINQAIFLVVPVAVFLVVLRIPIVRLIYGTDIFDWQSTVQTSLVVSAFAFGIVFQVIYALLARAFYAMHDTKTPVTVSVSGLILNIALNFILIKLVKLPVWGLAASFSFMSFYEALILYFLISKKFGEKVILKNLPSFTKTISASLASGSVMFFLLKFFDRSVWVKRLSFLSSIDSLDAIQFEKFVLDTRYTLNLLILTLVVLAIGVVIYLVVSRILKSQEFFYFEQMVRKFSLSKKVGAIPSKEQEPVTPSAGDTSAS